MERSTRSGIVRPPSPGRPRKREKSRSASRSRKGEKNEDPSYKAKQTSRKSPARKSPSRKSPSRKTVRDKTSSPPNKIVNKVKDKIADIRDSITPDKKVEEIIRASVTRFEEVASDFVATVRRSNRIASSAIRENSLPVNDRFTSKTSSYQENNVHSDGDQKEGDQGNWFITLVVAIALPAVVMAAQLACTKESCAPIPPKVTLTWRRFFDLEAASWYLSYLGFQLILGSLPLGFKHKSLGRMDSFTYRSNGPAVLVATAGVLIGLQLYLNFPVTRILDKSLPILSTSIITAFILGVLLYVKAVRSGAKRSEVGQTDSHIVNAFVGAETNPRIGSLDIKTAIIRTSIITLIIYNSLLIFREVQGKNLDQILVNVVLSASLQIFFSLEVILFESSLLSSFTVNHDGTGLLLTLYCAVIPFWITLIPKYLYLSKSSHNLWVVGAAVLVFAIGFLILRISNYQKTSFKKDTSSVPSSDVIHSRSSSLFKGGLWGKVRHPNYLGVLLIYTSWAILAIGSAPLHWIPLAIWLGVTIELICVISRVETSCQARHATAWTIYTSQVKHRLIPKVF